MGERPSFEYTEQDISVPRRGKAMDIVKRAGRFSMFGLAGSALYALVVGPRSLTGVSDGLFISGAILMLGGLLPWLSQFFDRATASGDSKEASLHEILEERRERSQRVDPSVLSLSISGTIVIAFSFVVGLLVG